MDAKQNNFFALIDMGGVGSYCNGETAFDAMERCKKIFEMDMPAFFKIDGEEFHIAVFDVAGVKEYWWQNGRVFDSSGDHKEKEIKALYHVNFRATVKKGRGRKAA